MMTIPASSIRDEVRVLIDVQVETFGQPASLTSSQLREFHDRSETIRALCQTESDRCEERYRTAVGEGVLAPRVVQAAVTSSSYTLGWCSIWMPLPIARIANSSPDGGNYVLTCWGILALCVLHPIFG